jgi:hypothetical protein
MNLRSANPRTNAIFKSESPGRDHSLAPALSIPLERTIQNMNRTERRAAARQDLKLARKAGFQTEQQSTTPAPAAAAATPPVVAGISEPGVPFPSLSSLTSKSPISAAQLAANRTNAQHSTGAKTESGRATSSQNHTSHGLARHNGAFVLLSSEDPNGFEALNAALTAEHQPTTETESILVTTMAESHWLVNRAQNLQNSCFHQQTGQITDAKMFSLYLRYQTTHTRAFHKSLNDLLKLRAETRKTQNGFEAQNRKQEELRIKNENHELKKQSHYWDILRKDAEACHQLAVNTTQQVNATKENPGFEAQYNAELAKRGLQRHPTRAATAA